MTRFYILKDGKMVASTADKATAVDMIRQYQAAETHYMLRAEFSIIEGAQEFIPYKKQRATRTA